VAVVADISSIKEAEKRLEFLAHHDPLTGLVNRVMFNERLSRMVTRATRHASLVGLLYVDLDGFKHVNDSFGHAVGDELLIQAAERLKHCVRSEDTLARLGGDEFGILVEGASDAWSAGQVSRKILEALCEPFHIDGRDLVIGASIGVSLYPTDGKDAAVLVRNADTAMYKAKASGGNAVHFYTPSLTRDVQRRVSIEAGLRHAMERGEFELYYQPIVGLLSGRVVSAECLLRWRDPVRGVMQPDSFLPTAEMSGLIVQIGTAVLDLALAQLVRWRQAGLSVPRLAINVSARQCSEPDFVDIVRHALSRSGVPCTAIEFEITESSFLDRQAAERVLEGLRQLGVSLTIDDFGTGYATIASLRGAPISAIKIDRAFVDDLAQRPPNDAIARAVIALGKSQDLTIIAEGVELEAQRQALAALDCDACQGYLIAPPMNAGQFANWLEARRDTVETAWPE